MKKYIRNNNTVSGRLHEEIVMMDIDKGKYFSLNEVSTRIWDHLEKPLSLTQICEKLQAEYEVSEDVCLKQTENHLKEMVKLSLIKVI